MPYSKKIKILDNLRDENKAPLSSFKGNIILETEDEIMKYVSCCDMKLSVVLLKLQLNSLLMRYMSGNSEISAESLRTSIKLRIFSIFLASLCSQILKLFKYFKIIS